uniref:CBS domain-containing protein n=1 Tax=Meloidogyne enterolobii TaxID=390850 RepID=A0A6V7X6T6_MELEN|nr:unnamed protein product [Meloidogyne enterolobii]
MLPTQQPGVSVSSAPALSPNKSIKQRQRQRTLNEQLDLLDRQFCVEVDVQMANRMDSISVSTPSSKDFYKQKGVNKMFSKSLDGVFQPDDLSQSPYSPPTKTSRIQNFFRYYSPNPVTQHQALHKGHYGGKHSPFDFSTSARPSMTNVMHAQQSKSISDFGPSSFGSRIVLIPPTTENAAGCKTALLIKNEDSYSNMGDSMPEINKILFESQEAVYSLFMKAHKCYDIVPTSSKLVVFDTQLPVSKAFFALVYNGVRAAPLWDSSTQEFVGMLTITDFIQILHRYYKNDQMEDGVKLEEHKISTWRDIFKADCSLRPFITVDPTESLYRAVQLLCEHKIHRLPVMEHSTGNILYILTHKRLIKFLHLYISDLPKPAFMDKTPKELGIGSWENILTIDKSTPLIEAMKTFLSKRVSALPLIDSDGKVVDIYAKFDVINLAADKTYDKLDVTVYEALKQRSEWFEGVRRCSDKDSLNRVIDILVKAEVHRLVAVDDENRAVGIISLSDVLRHLILELPGSKDIERQIANAMGAREPSDTGILDLESSIEDVHVAQRV